MTDKRMTDTEYKVIKFLGDYFDEHHEAPLLREIVDAIYSLNWRSSARYVLNNLEEAGVVTVFKKPGYKRRYGLIYKQEQE